MMDDMAHCFLISWALYVYICAYLGSLNISDLYACPNISFVSKPGRSWEHPLYVLIVVPHDLGVYLRLSLWDRRDKIVKLLVLGKDPLIFSEAVFLWHPLCSGLHLILGPRYLRKEKQVPLEKWRPDVHCQL